MIRLATIHDLPAIAKVHSICFPDSYSSQLCKLKKVIGGGTIYRGYLNNKMNICKIISVTIFSISLCMCHSWGAWQGYVQSMMEACLAAMKAHKCKLCLLSVKAGNLWAQCYYKRNGFEICRTSGEDGLTYINFSIFINKQVDIYSLAKL